MVEQRVSDTVLPLVKIDWWNDFGMAESPFGLSPDVRFMYLSSEAKQILAKVSFMVEARQGLSVIYGPIGTGKSSLANWLEHRYRQGGLLVAKLEVGKGITRSVLPLLRMIAEEFDLEHRRSISEQTSSIKAMLLDHYAMERQNAVLIIDEAQALSPPHFSVLREMLNFERPDGKLLQIVLLGMPALQRKLSRAKALYSRAAIVLSLDPLGPGDTGEMIRYRLLTAGRREPLFTADASRRIYLLTGGVPRNIVIICLNLCLEAHQRGIDLIDGPMVDEWADEEGERFRERIFAA
jgi:general secretion pathway protein A